MTQTFVMGFDPIWYIPDLSGLPAGGGSIATFSSLDPTMPLPIYQDNFGINTYPNPLLLGMNSTPPGPLFFLIDTAVPGQNYDIFVYDANGNLIWNVNDYTPTGGGGGDVTVGTLIENIVPNSAMYRNTTQTPTPLPVGIDIAPGGHSGLSTTSSTQYTPDVRFVKNNTSAVDQITFIPFILGAEPLTDDNTPYDYCNYSCKNTPSGETFKYVQFPITNKVQNFSNQAVALNIWARSNSEDNTLTLFWAQFFGSGAGATAPIRTQIGDPITLTADWAQYQLASTVPDVAGMDLGGCGDDGLFLQIQYPLDVACNIDFCKPCAYLGTIAPTLSYQPYDEIEAYCTYARTGDVRVTINALPAFSGGIGYNSGFGWVIMNDGTIGNQTMSGTTITGTSNATTRANNDTFPLFQLIWSAFVGNQALAPMFTSAGAPVVYGADAATDFLAFNQLSLTKQAGRLIAGVGTPSSGQNTGTFWPIGVYTGNELTSQVVQHTHQINFALTPGQGGTGTTTVTSGTQSTGGVNSQTPVSAINIQNPVNYYNIYMKL